jgi:tripartite-type tricarboxylate transporter receptor subunit TctC
MKTILNKILISICLILSAHSVSANDIKLVVPLTSGATMDDIARAIAPTLGKKLHKTIIVENRPGASGAIGMSYVANSQPDGLTLVVTNNGLSNMVPLLNPNAGYTSSSFKTVGLIGVSPLVLVTGPSIPANNLKELIEYVKSNPGKASWASPGLGTNLHLLGELLKSQQDLDMVHIQYKGMSQAMLDVTESRVTMMFDVPNPRMFSFFETTKMKPIAVTGNKRLSQLPTTLTVNEQGFSFLNSHVWFGVAVPAGTSATVISQLQTALNETLEDVEVANKLKMLGIDPSGIKPVDSQKYVDTERKRWTSVITKSNIKFE